MSKIKILGISPYQGMSEILQELANEEKDVEIDCFVADMKEAVQLIENIPTENYDIIISRGGTATLLNKYTNIPVIDSGISSLDVLRAIRLAENFSEDFCIIGFENITTHARLLAELMEYSVLIYTIENANEAEKTLTKLLEKGIHTIVCDVITSQIADKLGINSILITSGYESIKSALTQAIEFAKKYNILKARLAHLSNAFEKNPVKCIVFDPEGRILHDSVSSSNFPPEVLKYLQDNFNTIWNTGSDYIEKKFGHAILKFQLYKRLLKNKPYLYIYLLTISNLPPESKGIHIFSRDDILKNDIGYYLSSHSIGNILEMLDKYSRTSSPIAITGEEGTGKDSAALYLYAKSNEHRGMCYLIDCGNVSAKEWNHLYHHSGSPLMDAEHAIYFKHVDALPPDEFHMLITFLKDSCLWKRNRLIFSLTSCSGKDDLKTKINFMLKNIPCILLNLPTLRDRTDDIPRLATFYINQLNTSLGKQIVGFEPKALPALRNFPWYGNLDQFKRVIKELMILTTSSYISYENTMHILRQETSVQMDHIIEASYQININKPLNSIIYDISQIVLEQENGNHTKTAQRLGISRSTLWRIQTAPASSTT